MIKESELNKARAEKLATLMANHPDMRVIAWIDTDGINDDYCYIAGNIYEPHIETLIIGKDNMYHEKEDSPYDDCGHYYGWKEVDEWTDEEIEEKANQIPWEDVIAVRVGVN
jgi:hypothetical protein